MATRHVRVGIDVGSFSVGMTALEVDDSGIPIRILSSVSHIHDSGLDKDGKKQALTRREVSGVARRARRLQRERRRRLNNLDKTLESLGYPVIDSQDSKDPYLVWRVRAELAERRLPTEQLPYALSMAVRHIARHRGSRNPYMKAEALLVPAPDSEFFTSMTSRVLNRTGEILDEGLTPGQVMNRVALTNRLPMRGADGFLGKLHQSDNANEIRRICEVQGIPEDQCHTLILAVFAAKSPRGSALGRVGHDPLPGQQALLRAPKCDPAFQRFRIVSIVANLRIVEDGSERVLTPDERRRTVTMLMESTADDLAWVDVAELLGIRRQDLRGTASLTADGERSASRPPVDVTNRVMLASKIKQLRGWWASADGERRSAMASYLYEGTEDAECAEVLASLPEEEQAKLDSLHLPAGRAAYSRESLELMTDRMLSSDDDLHAARKHVFHVDDKWTPPADPIGAPVGNPAVDRTVKAVARYLNAVESVYGTPEAIQIEHVRDGFMSEKSAREADRENNRRYKQSQRLVAEIHEALGVQGAVHRSDVMRYEAIVLQDGICVYCGTAITYTTAQLDHIVPQAGMGSNNRRDNLVAVCERCNGAKSNTPFSVWAQSSTIPGVSLEEALERVKGWRNTRSMRPAQLSRLKKEVMTRLRRTQADPPLDERSIESVAWMANELHHRVKAAFPTADVAVYRGSVTAGARKAAGIDSKVNLLGERGRKDRLDRRHHAVDAAVIAMMRPRIAKTLAERSSLRWSQMLAGEEQTWKQYTGMHPADRSAFESWTNQMERLVELLNVALAKDQVHVTENLRLRLGNGAAHDDTIRPLSQVRLGDGLTPKQVDRAASPALWCALTREPDYDSTTGLPASGHRVIRVHGRPITSDDTVPVFMKKNQDESPFAAIEVRGGFAEIGSTIHHARVYRIEGRKPTYGMVRVFACDLLPHRHEDLFTVALPPQSISMRCADPKVRAAIAEGRAEYLGWLVVGDEIEIDPGNLARGQVGEFLHEYPGTQRWRLRGFDSNTVLCLRPSELSGEGLADTASEPIRKVLVKPGWRPSVNALMTHSPHIIRRDSLGRPRLHSSRGLPGSWTIQ